jgi:hypothetical protein
MVVIKTQVFWQSYYHNFSAPQHNLEPTDLQTEPIWKQLQHDGQ